MLTTCDRVIELATGPNEKQKKQMIAFKIQERSAIARAIYPLGHTAHQQVSRNEVTGYKFQVSEASRHLFVGYILFGNINQMSAENMKMKTFVCGPKNASNHI